jgi:hypothetical protein
MQTACYLNNQHLNYNAGNPYDYSKFNKHLIHFIYFIQKKAFN